jgi:hypothetical protein
MKVAECVTFCRLEDSGKIFTKVADGKIFTAVKQSMIFSCKFLARKL